MPFDYNSWFFHRFIIKCAVIKFWNGLSKLLRLKVLNKPQLKKSIIILSWFYFALPCSKSNHITLSLNQ